MSSESNNNAELSGALSLLNIESNELNNTIRICAACGKEGDGDFEKRTRRNVRGVLCRVI